MILNELAKAKKHFLKILNYFSNILLQLNSIKMVAEQIMQQVALVNGEFSPSEALNMVNALLGERINAHKIKRFHADIGSEYCDVNQLNYSIEGLIQEKKGLQQMIDEAKARGYKVAINATLEVSIV